MKHQIPIYSHNPRQSDSFPLLVLDVRREICIPRNEGFRVLHWHEEIQFVYVLKGSIHVKIYEEERDVSAGGCIFINRSALHHITEKEDCHYHSYLVPERMLSFFPGSIMEKKDVNFVVHNPRFTHYVLSTENPLHAPALRRIRQLDTLYFSSSGQPHHEYRISLALLELWLEFLSLLPDMPEDIPSRSYERIRTLLSFIHTSYQNAVTVEDIARSAHISQTECVRCFRRFLGESPYQYLLRYRLHMSTSFLRNTEMTVTEIALQVGFHSVSSYIGHFKSCYGKTPAQYRLEG